MKLCPLCETTYPSHYTVCDLDQSVLIESRILEPGAIVRSKYRIVQPLKRGGMGMVYRAEHIMLGAPRALKFISHEVAHDPKFLKRFLQEAQAGMKLRHTNIVEIFDLEQAEDGSPYIAMEFMDGPDLRTLMNSGPVAIDRALAIIRGAALGLSAAHEKGIVHRDIKPENIMLTLPRLEPDYHPETPKVLDFGIAAMRESSTAMTRTRGLMLTPEYAAPEQWMGKPASELDGRTDLYALGGVLHELLTGKTTFHSQNTEGLMYQHLQGQRTAPSQLRPELAQWPGLDAFVLRLLSKDREDRPANAQQLIVELDRVRQRLPPVLPSVPPVIRPTKDRSHTLTEAAHPAANRTPTQVIVPGASQFTTGPQNIAPASQSGNSIGVRFIAIALVLLAVIGAGTYFAWPTIMGQKPPVAVAPTNTSPSTTSTGISGPVSSPVPGTKDKTKPHEDQTFVDPPPSKSTLAVTCDMACIWKVDGVSHGKIEAAIRHEIQIPSGAHQVTAEAADVPLPGESQQIVARSGTTLAQFSFAEANNRRLQNLRDANAAKIRDLDQRAEAKYKAGDNDGAIELYNEALRLDPKDQAAVNGKAEILKECRILGTCGAK